MFGLGSDYNYSHFTKELLAKDLAGDGFRGPEPGDRAPDFELRSLEGDVFRLSDFRGEKNVVLTFGSATCPMTAGSVGGISKLAKKFGDAVQFVLIYVREAHPGDSLPAHSSIAEKVRAAELLRTEEEIDIPVLVDDLKGTVHRKYSKLPNPAFIIDKSGRIAFRAMWSQPNVIEDALEQLLAAQASADQGHAVVLGGEDTSMPMSYPALHSYRALQRGGRPAIEDFEQAMGIPGRFAVASSRIIGPVAENPGKSLLAAALGAGVLAAGVYAGVALRRKRLHARYPYRNFPVSAEDGQQEVESDYGVVGI